MNNQKTRVHFADKDILSPTNPISVNVIGAGGTGSKMITALMEMNHALIELGHPGLSVRLWDNDIITQANLGRQRFAQSEVGIYKSIALINRCNRESGCNWKAETQQFNKLVSKGMKELLHATITISCVDQVQARFDIAEILKEKPSGYLVRDTPLYWMDFGNSVNTGQVILSTVKTVKQPESQKYETVSKLPDITEEFGDLLRQSEKIDDTPSCSLADALKKQDLYINSSLVPMGSSLLWNLFRNGMISYRGFFLNLKDFRTQPVPV